MSFGRPDLLPLVLLLPLLAAAALWAFAHRRRRAAEQIGDAALVGRLGGGDLRRFPLARLLLVCGAAACMGFAAAGPQWGDRVAVRETRSLNAVLALDISKSMLAADVSPDRLERERLLARRILRELPGDRFGLVVFAGRAYVLSPLTVDHSALSLYLDALAPDIVSQGGSSLAAALTQATDLARGTEGTAGQPAIILISDGEALEDEDAVIAAADRAARAGVRVFTAGIGTERGAPIVERDANDNARGYKKDENGQVVITRLNPALLTSIAERTGGAYYQMDAPGGATHLLNQLNTLERTTGSATGNVQREDHFALFLLLALLLLGLDLFLARRRIPLPDGEPAEPPFVTPAPRLQQALILLLALSLTAFGIGDLERGNKAYRAGHYAEAAAAYEAALRDGEDSPMLRYNLGTSLLRLGRYAEAEQHLQKALAGVDPELRERALYNLGNRFLSDARSSASSPPPSGGQEDGAGALGRLLDSAIEAYKRALRLAPSDDQAKWNLELALREQEQQKKQQQQQQQKQQGNGQQPQQQGQSGGGANPPGAQGEAPRNPGSGNPRMTREQADRILSAVEQDERQLTREKLRKGQRRTAVVRDW